MLVPRRTTSISSSATFLLKSFTSVSLVSQRLRLSSLASMSPRSLFLCCRLFTTTVSGLLLYLSTISLTLERSGWYPHSVHW